MPGGLIGESHDAREQRRRKTCSAQAIFRIPGRPIQERLGLPDQVTGAGITVYRNVGHRAPRPPLSREDALLDNPLLVAGLTEEPAHAAPRAVEPRARRRGTPGDHRGTRRVPTTASGAPASLEQVVIRGANSQTGAADCRHEWAGRRPIDSDEAVDERLIAVVARREVDADAFDHALQDRVLLGPDKTQRQQLAVETV